MALWTKLLAHTDWKMLLDFASPSLFDVFPTPVLMGQARRLLASTTNDRSFRAAAEARSLALGQVGEEELRLARVAVPSAQTDPGDGEARGQAILRLFFHQLYDPDGAALLDLRHRTVHRAAAGTYVWSPGRPHLRFSPAFRAALHDLYGGFYDGDDARFTAGLEGIGAVPAGPLFRETFGADDPRAVAFALDTFVRTFHHAFERCRDAGSMLHPELIPFGVYLAMLYEHLAEVGGRHDVVTPFQQARSGFERRAALSSSAG